MRRPTETSRDDVRDLGDHDAPDFLEEHPVALLAFLTEDDATLRARLGLLAARHPKLAVGAIDVDSDRLVAEAMGVKSAPTLVLFVDGEAVDRVMGAPPDVVLDEMVRVRGA